MMNNAPCMDCDKRKLKCHGSCPLYKEWKADRKTLEEAIREQKSRSYQYERRTV